MTFKSLSYSRARAALGRRGPTQDVGKTVKEKPESVRMSFGIERQNRLRERRRFE